MMNGGWGHGWMGTGIGGGLLMLLIWGLAVVGLVALVRWILARPDRAGTACEPGALEQLQRRFTSGQIDRQTYEQVRAKLESRS